MKYLIFFFLALFTLQVSGQNPVLKVVTDTSCSSFIETPILMSDFDSVAAISMKIVFDTTRLTYLGYRNAHPSVSQNGNFIASTYQDRFIVGWFSLNPITVNSDTLLVIRWQGTAGPPVRLWFDTTRGMCELVDFYGVRFNTQFIDGAVAPEIRTAPTLVSPPDTSGLISTDILFVYRESPCRTGPSIIQVSRDSSFPEDPLVSSYLTSSTFYRWFPIPFCSNPFAGSPIPENGPCWHSSSGDSLIYWRVGAVYDSDTLWSDSRRISLGLAASTSSNSRLRESVLYPNPVENRFCIRGNFLDDVIWRTAVLRSYTGVVYCDENLELIGSESLNKNNGEMCYLVKSSLSSGYYLLSVIDRRGFSYFFPFFKI